MPMFAMNPEEVQNGYNNAAANPYIPMRDSAPGFFEGSGTALPTGFEQGGIETAQLFDHFHDQQYEKSLKALRPDPQTTGWLANVLQSVGSVVTPAAIGTIAAWGNPVGGGVAVGEVKGYAKKKELMAQGVDDATATEAMVVEGVTQGAGVMVPASAGGGLVTRAATGAAFNTGMGIIQRGATGKVLDAGGYKEMADQYKVLDGMQMFTDATIGSMFGALHTEGAHPELPPSVVDAGNAANNIHQLELDSAPGIPADLATRNAHVDAITTATEQLLRDEPVNVDLAAGNFLPHPETADITAFQKAIAEEAPKLDEPLHPVHKLTYDQAVEEAMKRPETINSPDYNSPERKAIREDVVNRLYGEGAAKKDGVVEIIMGPPGAGKSSAIANELKTQLGALEVDPDHAKVHLPEYDHGLGAHVVHEESKQIAHEVLQRAVSNRDNIVYPIIGANKKKVVNLIDSFKEKGYTVNVRLVHVAPETSIARVKSRFAETGRAVPLQVVTGYGNKPVDTFNAVKEKVNDYAHYSNETPGQPAKLVERSGGGGQLPGRGDSGNKEGNATEGAAEIAASERIIAEKPDLKIPDEAGAMTAVEAMQKADADISQAKQDSALFETAVNCLLRFGA